MSPDRHESLSRMPQAGMPVQRGAFGHARTVSAQAVGDAWAMPSSVIGTSARGAAKPAGVLWKPDGGPARGG
ncbi:hypothetical protein ACE1SV_63350 [Streptomyces sp. E-15]